MRPLYPRRRPKFRPFVTRHAKTIDLRIYPKSQVVYRGGDIVIQCRDEGNLRADVYWARLDGKPLPQERAFDNR